MMDDEHGSSVHLRITASNTLGGELMVYPMISVGVRPYLLGVPAL